MSLVLTANTVSPTEVDLSWTDSIGTAVHYQILNGATVIATVPSATLAYNDVPTGPYSTYAYTVNGLNSVGAVIYTSNTVNATTGSVACDAYWSNVSLLLTMDGVNGSTTFLDSSSVGNTMSASHAQISTANPMFGTGAAEFTSALGAITTTVSAHGPLDLTDPVDFTIEGWLNFNNLAGGTIAGDFANNSWFVAVEHVSGGIYNLQIDMNQTTGGAIVASCQFTPTIGVWYPWAVCMRSNVLTVFLNGNVGLAQPFPGSRKPTGGTFDLGTAAVIQAFPGLLDEFRVTKGYARYSGAYTASPTAFPGTCSVFVPNVVGEILAQAETDITAVGLTVGTVTSQMSLTVPGGYVISTSPIAGVGATVGDPVAIVESSGPGVGTVPDVINLSESLAVAAIIAAGFTVGLISFQPDAVVIAGNVDVQNPAGGASAFLLSPVNITISTGLPGLFVPDIFGMTEAEAIALLESLGLVVGAIGSAPSKFVPPNTVMSQNPSAGAPVAVGTIVSFVLSLGVLAVGTLFDFEATVISQYANSPTLLQLISNMNQYVDQSANFANFYNYVWNVDTAVGFGLDIWGAIVGVARLLQIPNSTAYVGFYQPTETQPDQDWTPAGSNQPPQPAVGGAFYTGHNATDAYLLPDDAYRQLILAKAFANICTTTAPAINQILQNLYGPGTAWVLNTGPMAISYNLSFTPTAIQLAILEQSGVIPTPPGVSVVINTNV